MITKIQRLKNVGKFYDFSSRGPGLDWHKNTFLFAPNAYGKSTLVDICRSLRDNNSKIIQARKTLGSSTNPEAVFVIDGINHVFNGIKWEKAFAEIKIFDVPFIHANILTDEIEHEHRKNMHKIIIGAAGVKLAEDLSALKSQEKNKRQQIEGLRSEFRKGDFKYYNLETFLAIPIIEETTIQTRILDLENGIKSKGAEPQVRTLSFPKPIIFSAFDLTEARILATKKLASAHEEAEKHVLLHIEQNIPDKNRARQFIRMGLELAQAACPFCGQDLKAAAGLLDAYRKFFNETFRVFQTDLSQTISQLDRWNVDNELTGLVSSYNANIAIVRQWEPYIGAQTLADVSVFTEKARNNLTASKMKVRAELEKKQRDPNCDCDLSLFDSLVTEVAALSTLIETYNNTLTNFTVKAKSYIENLPKSAIDELRNSLSKAREVERRFKPEWKTWVTSYAIANKDAADLLAKKEIKQKELESYTLRVFDNYQKRINELLGTLGTDFTITDLSGKTDERANECYSDFGFLILEKKVPLKIRQDDAACLKNTLSEGDKSTLAFVFFLASLEKVPGLDKHIIIFDDPLSSLDETRREATARVLLELSPKLNQLCVFTHKKDFLWMLCDKMPDNNVFHLRSDKAKGSRIEPLNITEDRKGAHAKTIEEMQRYVVEDFGLSPDLMQGNIRKTFEVVLKTKFYLALSDDIKNKKGLAKLLETLFTKGLIDLSLKPKLFDLCNVTNGPHHGDIVDAPAKHLTREEVIALINETLSLIEKI
jgi:wobble nucleotide-excising tRNase